MSKIENLTKELERIGFTVEPLPNDAPGTQGFFERANLRSRYSSRGDEQYIKSVETWSKVSMICYKEGFYAVLEQSPLMTLTIGLINEERFNLMKAKITMTFGTFKNSYWVLQGNADALEMTEALSMIDLLCQSRYKEFVKLINKPESMINHIYANHLYTDCVYIYGKSKFLGERLSEKTYLLPEDNYLTA